jgi:hypothetical protein
MTYEDLGDRIEAEWAGCKYEPSQFPRIAKEALDAVALPELEASRLLLDPTSQTPFTSKSGFQIEVRATSNSAEIRADARRGALRVAEGRGIRTQYEFTPSQSAGGSGGTAPAPKVHYGVLEQKGACLADANAEAVKVEPIAESVFPVISPFTIVVVTLTPPAPPKGEQPWMYQRPGVALRTRRDLDDLVARQTWQIRDTIKYARGFYVRIDALREAMAGSRDDLQFFLALLMTQQKRDFLLELVQDWGRIDRDEALQFVTEWVETLLERNVLNEFGPEPASVAAYTDRWSQMKDQVEAVTSLLRRVRVPVDDEPDACLPPPV